MLVSPLLLLLSAAAVVVVAGVETSLRVEYASVAVQHVNSSWCQGDGTVLDEALDVALVRLRLSEPVRRVVPLDFCHVFFGGVGSLRIGASWVPIEFPRAGDARRMRDIAVPACAYESADVGAWLSVAGLHPRWVQEQDPYTLTLLTAHPEHVSVQNGDAAILTLYNFFAGNGSTAPVNWAEGPRFAVPRQVPVPALVRTEDAWVEATVCGDAALSHGAHLNTHLKPLPPPPSALLESRAYMQDVLRLGIPFAKKVLDPIIAPMLKPAANFFVQHTAGHVMEPTSQIAGHEGTADIPDHVVEMMMETLPPNVTNFLQDSLTADVSKTVWGTLSKALGPHLVNTVPDGLSPRLHTSLHHIFNESIPVNVNRGLSNTLYHALMTKLMQSLTRSITHSLVPVLTATRTPSNANTEKFCRQCFDFGEHCSLCHYSRESIYYTTYHGAFYSDYFADYYAEYYGLAIESVEKHEYLGAEGSTNELQQVSWQATAVKPPG